MTKKTKYEYNRYDFKNTDETLIKLANLDKHPYKYSRRQ